MLRTLSIQALKLIPSHKVDFFGPTSLLYSTLPYYSLLYLIITGIGFYELTRNPYISLFMTYTLIPIIDEMITLDTRNPTYEEAKTMAEQIKYEIPLYLTILVDWGVFFYALNQYSTIELNFSSFFMLLGLVITVSNLNASQFPNPRVVSRVGFFPV